MRLLVLALFLLPLLAPALLLPASPLALVRRISQAGYDAIDAAFQTFATHAGEAVKNGSGCAGECGPWGTEILYCDAKSNNNTDVAAACYCEGGAVGAMQTCGACLGGSDDEAAKSVANLCTVEFNTDGTTTASNSSTTTSSQSSASDSSSGCSSFALGGLASVALAALVLAASLLAGEVGGGW
ncbi:hypothetical protein JCM10207_000178 [Rhodosporidiobolus poonsookiae]